jgi:hypothetical protein
MKSVDEHLNETLPRLRESKEKIVHDTPEDPDSPTVIEVFRNEQRIATMMSAPDRDLMLLLIKFSIIGLKADRIMFSFEGVTTKHPVNPGTGKPWGEGEIQKVLQNKPDYWVDGLIEETILTSVWDRNGQMAASVHRFSVEGQKVIWGEETISYDGEDKTGMKGGLVPDEIASYWRETTIHDEAMAIVKKEIEEMSEAERLVRMDIAVMTFMRVALLSLGKAGQVMIAMHASTDPDDERTKHLTARIGQVGGVLLPPNF